VAIFANAIGVNETPDRRQIAFLELAHFAPDFHNASYNFVTGHAGVNGATPFVAHAKCAARRVNRYSPRYGQSPFNSVVIRKECRVP